MVDRAWMGIVAAALALSVAACKNSNYCEGNPNNDCRATSDGSVDTTPPQCTSSAMCAAPTSACDLGTGTCVQCIAPSETSACTGATPVCDADHTCRGCTSHTECPSAACLPDGSCATDSQVAYVAASGSGTACSLAAPCALLAQAVATNRPYIKVAASGAAHDTATTIIDGKAVTILADPGAVLDRDGDGPIIEVRSANADVKIFDLTISGATSASGHGVLVTPNGGSPSLALTRVTITTNQGAGVSASGGSVTITQSTISSNQGGGISVSGTGSTFSITNNFIYRNGDPDVGTFGGANLAAPTAGTNVFSFNTVVDNRASTGSSHAGGVFCDITGFTGPNNIIARNYVNGSTTTTTSQTFGLCTYPTSEVQNDTTGLSFNSADIAPYDYRLMAGSIAIDAATTSSSVAVDHDGDARPQGANKDCGADELKL